MRFFALATDYDGTIAHHGAVDKETVHALEALKGSGRKLILVTGRELEDLLRVFPRPELFDRIVAENGALLYRPDSREEQTLAPPPPAEFAERLRQRDVRNLSVGRVIVSTYEPYETVALEVIRELGLELHVIFNKGAVMILPSGCNKAVGLAAALRELGLSSHNVVGVGDAENDHAFLEKCGCSVAVANALPALKEKADWVTERDHGAGVEELIQRIMDNELVSVAGLKRHDLVLGQDTEGREVRLPTFGSAALIAGSSGGGKSTLTHALLERLVAQRLQSLLIDPEGDYSGIPDVLTLGSADQMPRIDELVEALGRPTQSVVANLVAVPLNDKPEYFRSLFLRLTESRAQRGRPHWILVDEAHHVLPASWEPAASYLPEQLENVVLVTVQPGHVSSAALRHVRTAFAIGDAPVKTLSEFARAAGREMPDSKPVKLEKGQALAWVAEEEELRRFEFSPPKAVRRRHVRKYAEGELEEDRCFQFSGPEGRLRLRAQNLQMFIQLADGVDDDTWNYHLNRGDYSSWLRTSVKDEELAEAVREIEGQRNLSPEESRRAVRHEIETRYTRAA